MTDVQTRRLPSSLGSAGLLAGFVAASNVYPVMPFSAKEHERPAPFVYYILSPSSFGEHAYIFSAARLAPISTAESELQTFYADLMTKQERLGKEFEQVLFDNLWNLYAR